MQLPVNAVHIGTDPALVSIVGTRHTVAVPFRLVCVQKPFGPVEQCGVIVILFFLCNAERKRYVPARARMAAAAQTAGHLRNTGIGHFSGAAAGCIDCKDVAVHPRDNIARRKKLLEQARCLVQKHIAHAVAASGI